MSVFYLLLSKIIYKMQRIYLFILVSYLVKIILKLLVTLNVKYLIIELKNKILE